MKTVVLDGPGSVRVAQTDRPESSDGYALVHPRLNGICGSDLAAYRGTAPQVSYPRVLGHEIVADVIVCAERPELVGERVVIEPLLTCGGCRPCRVGRPNCCARLRVLGVQTDGGLAEELAIEPHRLFAVPEQIPDEVAVLAEPTSVAYHAIQRSGVEAGQVAVVFGAGTIGLLLAQLLMRARGCRVVVVDVVPWRLETAASLGAVPVTGVDGVADVVRDLAGGELADVVFEATGNPACTAVTPEVVGAAGTVVLVGWNPGPVEIDTVKLMRKEVDLLGSRTASGVLPNVLRLLGDGAVDADALVSHQFTLDESVAAFDVLDGQDAKALKVLIHTGS